MELNLVPRVVFILVSTSIITAIITADLPRSIRGGAGHSLVLLSLGSPLQSVGTLPLRSKARSAIRVKPPGTPLLDPPHHPAVCRCPNRLPTKVLAFLRVIKQLTIRNLVISS